MTRALILTSSGGNGLVAASEAIAAALSEVPGDWESRVVDLPSAVGSLSRFLVNDLYNSLLRRDVGLCGMYVRVGEILSFHSWGDRLEDARRIRSVILGEDPDVVVVASPWVLRSVARAMAGSGVPVVSVVVDLGRRLPLGWVCNDVARGVAPTEAAYDYMIERGMDPDILEMGGIIVHPRYLGDGNGRGEAGSVLLLAGYEGTRRTVHLAHRLLRIGSVSRLQVMCGTNSRLLSDLSFVDDERLEPHGFVHDMLPFYRENRVVVTKCGAATLAECIATGRPVVVDATSGVMPQEIGNVDLVRDKGIGMVCTSVKELAGQTYALLDDTSTLDGVRERIAGARALLGPHDVARVIAREVEAR